MQKYIRRKLKNYRSNKRKYKLPWLRNKKHQLLQNKKQQLRLLHILQKKPAQRQTQNLRRKPKLPSLLQKRKKHTKQPKNQPSSTRKLIQLQPKMPQKLLQLKVIKNWDKIQKNNIPKHQQKPKQRLKQSKKQSQRLNRKTKSKASRKKFQRK